MTTWFAIATLSRYNRTAFRPVVDFPRLVSSALSSTTFIFFMVSHGMSTKVPTFVAVSSPPAASRFSPTSGNSSSSSSKLSSLIIGLLLLTFLSESYPSASRISVLGHDQSHATADSLGQSQAPPHHNQSSCPKPKTKTMGRVTGQSSNKQNVQAVMTPMSQPLGGWHVTSMTEQAKLAMTDHDQVNRTIG